MSPIIAYCHFSRVLALVATLSSPFSNLPFPLRSVHFRLVILYGLLAFAPLYLEAQSTINETLATNVYYASPTGSDANSGASTNAPKTLTGAMTAALVGNSKVLLMDGDYRLALTISGGSTILILQALNPGKAVISGSALMTNWTSYPAGYCTLPWTKHWGLGNNGFGNWTAYNDRLEMVFVDGVRLLQACDTNGNPVAMNTLAAGQFTVDETNQIITFRPPAGVALTPTNRVEAAVRNVNGAATALSPLVAVSSRDNLVFRGLVFQHVAGCVKAGPALSIDGGRGTTGSSQLRIEDCTFQNNNATGFEIVGYNNVTLNRVNASNNGGRGGGFYDIRNALVEDCMFNGNNWRCWPNDIGNDAAGFKTYDGFTTDSWYRYSSTNLLFLRCTFRTNWCVGYWEDTAGFNTTLSSCLFENNEQGGVDSEITPGPLTITNCVIRSNAVWGVMMYGSPGGKIVNSCLYATRNGSSLLGYLNDPQHCAEILPTLDVRTNALMPGPGNYTRDDHWTISNCVIQATFATEYHGINPDGVQTFDSTTYTSGNPNGQAKTSFITSLTSNSNIWWRANGNSGYSADQAFFSATIRQTWQDEFPELTFSQWTNQPNALGYQDLQSVWRAVNLSDVPDRGCTQR